jgi:histone-binding protein RBBP4
MNDYNADSGEIGGHDSRKSAPKFEIIQKIDHEGEVNKARYMPQNPNHIATMCIDGRVMVFDRTKHPMQPTGKFNPQMQLLGHTKEGFGLRWNPNKHGQLATASEDETVKLW